MNSTPRQLTLDLPIRSAFGLEDFFVSQSNEAAVAIIDAWPEWNHWAALLHGPSGAGKSHLAHVWQTASQAAYVTGAQLDEGSLAMLEREGALVVEDLDRGIADERILFHLLNMAREKKHSILLTSAIAPGELKISLPDLGSRLRALPVAAIDVPDEALLNAVLVKLFGDRQIEVEPQLISYLSVRMERSMASANKIVAQMDQLALEQKRRITRRLAQEALDSLASGGEDGER